jgi:hypothetical protein
MWENIEIYTVRRYLIIVLEYRCDKPWPCISIPPITAQHICNAAIHAFSIATTCEYIPSHFIRNLENVETYTVRRYLSSRI